MSARRALRIGSALEAHDGAASTQPRIVTDRRATRKINRLARAAKSGNAHAVKSFNMLGLAMKLTLRASRGYMKLIGYIHGRSAGARSVYACVVAAAGSGLIFTYLLQDSHATAAQEHRLCFCKTMYVHIDEADSCGHCYTRRCV